MNIRYPPFYSVHDFSDFNKWEELDDADKIRITARIAKRIQRAKALAKKQEDFLFQFIF